MHGTYLSSRAELSIIQASALAAKIGIFKPTVSSSIVKFIIESAFILAIDIDKKVAQIKTGFWLSKLQALG